MLTSAANARVKEARALLRRSQGGRFAGEGLQLAGRALAAKSEAVDVDYVFATPDICANPPSDIASLVGTGRLVEVSPALFERMSRRSMDSGVIFVGEARQATFADLSADVPVLVLDRASNPRNIGAIARTCEAAGLGGMVLCGHHADPFAYESVRASMGSVFGVPIVSASDAQMLDWAASRSLIGTSGAAHLSLWDAPLPSDAALLFGNEGEGLSDELLSACPELLKIPYNQTVDSLNLGAAVAVVSFEYRRRNPF